MDTRYAIAPIQRIGPFFGIRTQHRIFYDAVVVPGAVMLLISGSWLIAVFHDGWSFIHTPWLAGMVLLFIFEFIEGNTVIRIYFVRLNRLAEKALQTAKFTPELRRTRAQNIPTFTHFLDLPILLLIVMLGVLKPDNWLLLIYGTIFAIVTAAALMLLVTRLYPHYEQNYNTGR
ncbi:Predicted integral membrane protein [Nitrosomonas marina]|uniref:Predicted integral membrane protein n=1 Tax=Nitrosomonas marina TaxID=917 RepID=A0A1H8FZB0_9PROT|nr:Predicted integral membrane protein [Nitrosomonas marina]